MDKKKSSDIQLANKNWPRYGKKREKQSQTLQNDNNIQRNKNRQNHDKKPFNFNDRKPKPRNVGNNGNFNSHFPIHSVATSSGLALENSYDELDNVNDFENEIALNSIYLPGSKKQNLNHLLNFHYAPRDDHNLFGRGTNQRYNCSKKHKYNKEQYLQANFQFVIKSNAKKLIDPHCPDILIDWDNIEQIRMQTTEEPQCPICLYKPIAAKLTRCGHIYCWSCILHYLSLSDKNWRKCPICFDAVHIKDLKSALIIQQIELNVNNYVTFQLMCRKKNSIFCEKVVLNSEQPNPDKYLQEIPHLADADEKKLFSKFVLANYREILSVLDKEREELNENFDENCPESIMIQQALNLLNERKLELDKENQNVVEELIQNIKIDNRISKDSIESIAKITNQSSTGAISKDSKNYYFYQSTDGQNIFLHPLNVRMIQSMYGCLENGPLNIEAKIIQKEIQSMDEELRKKFTCLGHLPLTCQFSILEVELKPPIVSEEILNMFRDDIALRQKTRQRKAREENKREREINYLNERQIGKYALRSANINIQSAEEFPTCGFEEPLTRSSLNESYASDDKEGLDLPIQSPSNNSTSFAKILSSPKKEFWPSLSTTYSSTAAWPSAWNSRHSVNDHASASNSNQVQKHDDENSVQKMKTNNLADVIAEALQNGGKPDKKVSKKKSKKNKRMSFTSTEFQF